MMEIDAISSSLCGHISGDNLQHGSDGIIKGLQLDTLDFSNILLCIFGLGQLDYSISAVSGYV